MLLLSLLLTLGAVATAAPTTAVTKRELSQSTIDALHLALYLENLEQALFLRGCNGFQDVDYRMSGFGEGFRGDICVIAQQEAFHM